MGAQLLEIGLDGAPLDLVALRPGANLVAMGRAVVACAGSARSLVDDVTARVVPDGDITAFAAAVVSLLRDPAARRRLGRAARGTVEGGEAWERVLVRIESIYRQVLTAGAGGRRARAVPVTVTE